MAQKAQKNALSNETVNETANAAVSAMDTGSAEVVAMRPAKGQRSSIWDTVDTAITDKASRKAQLMSEARQRFAEAADYAKEGDQGAAKASEAADRGAQRIYQARVDGVMSADEATALLGDIFGFKTVKSTGKPSKTPKGMGEVARKRIVRAVAAHDFVNGGDGGRFFEPLESVKHEVSEIVARIGAEDGISIFTAYDNLQTLKNENTERANRNPAFDYKAVGKIVDALSENLEVSRERIVQDGRLFASYAALRRMIELVGEQA